MLFLNFALIAHSQDWQLLNPTYKYNYSINNDSFLAHTIWIDSITSSLSGDTVYHLNRIVVDCDSCNERVGFDIPKYAYYNQPQFMLRSVKVSDTAYTFSSPQKFTIFPKADSGYSWIFDTVNNITANINNTSEELVLDVQDSVKTILLSSGKTILISKNYGIVEFNSPYESKKYNLRGIDNVIGDSVPDFFDFFNFSIGDIFEYTGYIVDNDSEDWLWKNFLEKYFIQSKTMRNDSIIYEVYMRYRYSETDGGLYNDVKFGSKELEWIFFNNSDHPTNRYANELMNCSLLSEFKLPPRSNLNIDRRYGSLPSNYTKLKYYSDNNNLITKSIGSFDRDNYLNIINNTQYLLERQYDIDYTDFDFEYQYKLGLGEVYFGYSVYQHYGDYSLVAYAKGNDTVGVFTDDSFFTSISDVENDMNTIVYPNPVKDMLYVKSNGSQIFNELRIIGLA